MSSPTDGSRIYTGFRKDPREIGVPEERQKAAPAPHGDIVEGMRRIREEIAKREGTTKIISVNEMIEDGRRL